MQPCARPCEIFHKMRLPPPCPARIIGPSVCFLAFGVLPRPHLPFVARASSFFRMPPLLFYLLAAITLGFGLMVVTARNPVTCALSLASCFVGLAALFISLDAYFIGTIQVLVYAGAVMVLFLFIIMLLDIKAEEGRQTNLLAIGSGAVLAVLIALQIITVAGSAKLGEKTAQNTPLDFAGAKQTLGAAAKLPTIAKDLAAGTLPDTKLIGFTLFDRYGFHLQVVGLLLLVGTVGVVVLSKREKNPGSSEGGAA
jgi:NADH-quinone oxidoreductase subunit J